MVVKVNSNGRLIPSVGYLRRSDDKQIASIDDQRTAVLAYAASPHRDPVSGQAVFYQIIRWYVDDDISGDDTENREAFKRMGDDAQDRRDFEAILCWNQDRFGRFDQLEAGYWIHPLRKAGVYLVTCDMGRIDWESPEGQLIYGVNQMGKHKFLKDLSLNVCRGQLEAAKKGSWVGSKPYGYKIVGPRKNKSIVVDDWGKIAIVRRIFHEYVHEGRSLGEIARRLNNDGIPPPSGPGRKWRYDSVKCILTNCAYVGDFRAYGYAYGKYNQVHGKEIVKGGKRQKNPESDWVYIQDADTVEAVIDRDTFDKAQALIAKGKTGRSKRSPEDNPYVFSGLLRCGKCGASLNAYKDDKGRKRYDCQAHFYHGGDHCPGSSIREDRLLQELGTFLDSWLETSLGLNNGMLDAMGTAAYYGALKPEDVPAAFDKVKKLILPPPRPAKDIKRLQSELKKVTGQLATARANLILLDADNIPAAQARIRQLDARRQEIDSELAESKPPAEDDVNRVVLNTLYSLYNLAAACHELAQEDPPGTVTHSSDRREAPQAIRRFFGVNYHLNIHTERSGKGQGIRHKFIKAELVFRPLGKTAPVTVQVNTRGSNPHPPV